MYVLIFFTVFSGAIALANDIHGDPGVIKSLHRNASTSTDFANYHAELVIKTAFTDDRYKWGGNQCPGFDLSSIMEEALNAYVGDKNIQIEPFYKFGAGGTHCLVGFTVLNKNIK